MFANLFDKSSAREGSPTHWDLEDDGAELGPLSHHNTPTRSQDDNHTDGDDDDEGDDEGDDDDNVDDEPPRTSATISSATSTPHGQKQKSMADSIMEVSARERENRIKIAKINATAKTERSNQRETIKRHTNMELELARMQHQRDETAAQRAHETAMFDRQAALEMARAGQGGYGIGGPSAIHPGLR